MNTITNEVSFYYFNDINSIFIDKILLSPYEDLKKYFEDYHDLYDLNVITSNVDNYCSNNTNFIVTEMGLCKNNFIYYYGNHNYLYDSVHHYFKEKYKKDPFDNHDFLKTIAKITNPFSTRSDFAYLF